MNEILKKFKFWLCFLSVRWYHHEEASTLHIQLIEIGMKKMSFNLKQYDVGMVTMKYNFDGVGQSIMIIVFFMSNNTSSNGIFYLMQLHVELYIVNELCTLHRFWLSFLSCMNNVFANEKENEIFIIATFLLRYFVCSI